MSTRVVKGSRIIIFREALEGLIDSLDAVLRIERWAGSEKIPEALLESARQLVSRLGAANRLAAGRFSGAVADVARVEAIGGAVRRLDAAYVAYCRDRVGGSFDRDLAARTLDAELIDVRAIVA